MRGVDAGARTADSDHGHQRARAVANRRSEGDKAVLEFVHDLRPAAASDPHELRAKLARARQRPRR